MPLPHEVRSFEVDALCVRVVADPLDAARALADELSVFMRELRSAKRKPALGFAAGRTPQGLYAELSRDSRAREIDWTAVECFHLDEYLGLPPGHPASFRANLRRALHDRLGIPASHVHFPVDDDTRDPQEACERYEARLAAAGGLDWQLLGLGGNGHVAFNEPGSDAASRTRIVELSESTRTANRSDFASAEEVPREAVTMGIATIRSARRLRWMAFGAGKAAIVARFLSEPASPELPASLLRDHPDGELWIDEAAAAGLSS